MENLLNKDFFICETFEDYNLYLLKKEDLKEGIFTKYHCLFDTLSYDECFKERNLYEGDIFKIIDFERIKRKAVNYKELNDFTPTEEYLDLLKSEKYSLLVNYYPFGSLEIITVEEELNNLKNILYKEVYSCNITEYSKVNYVDFILNDDGYNRLYQLEVSKIYSKDIDKLEWKGNKIQCTIKEKVFLFELDKDINSYIYKYEESEFKN